MNRSDSIALIIDIINVLRENKSWAGETHVQKAVYIATKLYNVPFEYDFIIYKHGPFSFDLRDALTSALSDGFLEYEYTGPKYGPRLKSTITGNQLFEKKKEICSKYRTQIDKVGSLLQEKGVSELEKIATALFIIKELHQSGKEASDTLHTMKPHIDAPSAAQAIAEVHLLVNPQI